MNNSLGWSRYTVYPASYARLQDPASFDMSKAPGRSYKYYTGTPLFPFGDSLILPRSHFHPHTQCAGEPPFPVYTQYCRFLDHVQNLQIHAMRATFHIVFAVRI